MVQIEIKEFAIARSQQIYSTWKITNVATSSMNAFWLSTSLSLSERNGWDTHETQINIPKIKDVFFRGLSKTRMAHSIHWLMFSNGPLPWGPMTRSLTRIWPTGKNLLPPPESRRVICECWTLTLHVYLDSNGYVHGFLPKHQMEKPMMHVLWYLLAQKHKVGSASQTSNESN